MKFFELIIRFDFHEKEPDPSPIHANQRDLTTVLTMQDGSDLDGDCPQFPFSLFMIREGIGNHREELETICEIQESKKVPPLEVEEVEMFHKIKSGTPLSDYQLRVQFCEGCTKLYDVRLLFEKIPVFSQLKDSRLFYDVDTDAGGHGMMWNEAIGLSCEELWENGQEVSTPFDGLMALSDAAEIWGLNESILRKAISYGKLVNGVDVCKYGKQWVISTDSMIREYGLPEK